MARTAIVNVVANTAGFNRGLDQAQSRLGRFGQRTAAILKPLALPLIGAGIAVAKLTIDFEQSMSKIQGLAGVSTERLAEMRDGVLDLAGKTVQAPQELADALLFIASAGLKASEVMPALEATAKAATAGLGNMNDIALAVTSAMNAYEGQGLTAAAATDVLVASVAEGNLETDSLAGSIGRVLPLASTLGVTFDQVGASLSVMSLTGLNAEEATTRLQAIFTTILNPSNQAREALDKIGLSADKVRQIVAEDGLLDALRLLIERTNGNKDALGQLFPNVRALSGALAITGVESSKVDAIFDALRESTGLTEEAFKTAADTTGNQFKQAFVDLKVAAIQFGDALSPVMRKVAKELTKFTKQDLASFRATWRRDWIDIQQVVIGVANGIANAINVTIIGSINNAIGALNTMAEIQARVASFGLRGAPDIATIPTIPPITAPRDPTGTGFGAVRPRQTGGLIPGVPGQPVPIMAHGGEFISTSAQTRRMGGAGPIIVELVVDGRKLARAIAQPTRNELLRLRESVPSLGLA